MKRVTQAQSGATYRKLAITEQLKNVLEYAAKQADVKVTVTSGGQKHVPGAAGKSIKGVRTGSTRHDLRPGQMGAADVTLHYGDRLLNMGKPEDAAIMAIFVEACVAAGAVGVGAGVGYMGVNTIHVGGGASAVWGAGKGKPIASFIRPAHQRGLARFKSRAEVKLAQKA